MSKYLPDAESGAKALHCYVCDRYLPAKDFWPDKSRRSGFSSRCRSCQKERMRILTVRKRGLFGPFPEKMCEICGKVPTPTRRHRYCRDCARSRARRIIRTGQGWHSFQPEQRLCGECQRPYTAYAPHSRFCSDYCGKKSRGVKQSPLHGHAHRKARGRVAPLVASGNATCARCGLPIVPGEPWDLDHDDFDKSRYLGPSHRRCNRATETHKKERETA